ncbi:hypothetical protein RRG08_038557 [Elysia crispata]|uniref:Uncharacterized protein n=1 Tax=Elysia crispata TaxID=231223 RepID=A0AAE1ECA3_9GAST|nr:hypothetical protein RRG08_038557 [Elysia crispata]
MTSFRTRATFNDWQYSDPQFIELSCKYKSEGTTLAILSSSHLQIATRQLISCDCVLTQGKPRDFGFSRPLGWSASLFEFCLSSPELEELQALSSGTGYHSLSQLRLLQNPRSLDFSYMYLCRERRFEKVPGEKVVEAIDLTERPKTEKSSYPSYCLGLVEYVITSVIVWDWVGISYIASPQPDGTRYWITDSQNMTNRTSPQVCENTEPEHDKKESSKPGVSSADTPQNNRNHID